MKRLLVMAIIVFFGTGVCYGNYLLELEHIRQIEPSVGIGKWIYKWDEATQKNIIVGSETKICGPVSLLTVASYVDNFSLSNQKIKDIVDWMVTNGIYANANSYIGYNTDGNQIVDIAENYYDYVGSKWYSSRTTSFNEGIKLIESSLKNDVPVIIGTYLSMVKCVDCGHFMVADGLEDVNGDGDYLDDIDKIHVTDPATSNIDRKQKWYTISQFRNAYQGVLLLNPIVGHYSDGFHTDGTSQAFLDAYNRHFPKIGWPYQNGGGENVHQWGPVWIQDFQGDTCSDHYGTDGKTAIILNDFSVPYKAYLVKEGFWGFYKENYGIYNLGKPFTEEITAQYAKNPYSHYTDLIQAGDVITVQKFERACESGCTTERRTLVWKNGIEPQRFAVGEFSIGSEHCSNGVQMYVTRDSDPAHDIPWPQKGVLTPTGKWFTKPGIYDFVLHDENGQRKSGWGLTVPITEGNSQSTGDSWGDTTTDQDDLDAGLYSPENLKTIG